MAAEVSVGFVAHSLALISDAAHMLTDAASILLALTAMRLAARPARGGYTYGLKRTEILSAQANCITLLVLSAWLGYEAIRRLITRTPPRRRATTRSRGSPGRHRVLARYLPGRCLFLACAPKLFWTLPAVITYRVGPHPPDSGRGHHVPRGGQLYLYWQWSRPFHIDVCSMFARTPRYGPAGPGTHVTSPRRVAIQLRMS
jgi:hypothetical protein